MNMKNYRLIIKKLHWTQYKMLIAIFLLFCVRVQFSFSTNIWVRPYEIKFNYETASYTNDALTIKKDNSNYVTAPEWKYNGGNPVSEKFAYIKEQSSRKIQVRFDSNCNDMHLLINLTVTSGTGIGTVCNFFVENYDKLDDWVTLTLSGSLPGSVGIRSFTWQWSVYAIPIDGGYCSATSTNSTIHNYYTLLAAPQAPMAEPWTSVLDYACDWASGETTTSDILSSLTENLYNSGVVYDGGQHYTQGYTYLGLSDLLDDFSDPSSMQMDCRDFSNFLHVLTNAVGHTVEYNRIDMGCNYNYLFPAGWPSKASPGYWNYHQVGWYNSKVADAATKIDNDSDPTSSPHDWKLAVGDMTLPNYLDKLTEYEVESEATGTCSVY
jgi:hypothetical protein